jgi:hypothetical protein
VADKTGGERTCAAIARATGNCLSETTVGGVAGTGAEAGADLPTQQLPPQAQRLHRACGLAGIPSAGTSPCPISSKALNKMAKAAFTSLYPYANQPPFAVHLSLVTRHVSLLGFGLGLFDFLDVLGPVLFEVLQAIFAAEFDLAVVVGEDVRLAHFAELFI